MKPIKREPVYSLLIWIIFVFVVAGCTTNSKPLFQLTTSSVPAEGGTVTPAPDEYKKGTEVQLEAVANDNWMFDGWEGDQGGSENPVTITMNEDKTITARFVLQDYPLTVNTDGEGTVTETVVQNKSTDYQYGTMVQLEAKSSMGWNFGEWQGDLQGMDNPQTIMIDGPKTVTAVFDAIDYSVSVQAEGPGTATVDPQKQAYHYGDMVTFKAMPTGDNEFLGWFGTFEEYEAEYQHEITGDVDVTAYFSSVIEAILIETISISEADGKVDMAVFDLTNLLLNNLTLTEFNIFDETDTEVGGLVLSNPLAITPRSILELTITFDFETTDKETFKQWAFQWKFTYKGKTYVLKMVVGEPSSGSKIKSLNSMEPVTLEVRR